MYSRKFNNDDLSIPENYDGNAFTDNAAKSIGGMDENAENTESNLRETATPTFNEQINKSKNGMGFFEKITSLFSDFSGSSDSMLLLLIILLSDTEKQNSDLLLLLAILLLLK